MRVIVLHSEIGSGSSEDEQDTLVQVEAVSAALEAGGRQVEQAAFSPQWCAAVQGRPARELLVFNLVESVRGRGDLIYLAPGMLEALGLPYTGCPARAMLTATHKTLAKQIMSAAGIPTAEWVELGRALPQQLAGEAEFILKPVSEDASIALSDDSIVRASSAEQLRREISLRSERCGLTLFAERYIHGREFNIAVIGAAAEPQVLPLAEMLFKDFPQEKPRIVNYAAKWDESSFEYQHTGRTFEYAESDASLRERLREITLRCWSVFGLNGFARVDFRVDGDGRPWVLEINPNPGIAPDAGFVAAAAKAGIDYRRMVERIAGHPLVGDH